MSRIKKGRGKGGNGCATCLIICLVILVLMVVGVIVGANFAFKAYVSPRIGGVSLADTWSLIKGVYKADAEKIITAPYSEDDLYGADGFYANLNDALLQKPYTAEENKNLYIEKNGQEAWDNLSAEEQSKVVYYRVTLDDLLDSFNLGATVDSGRITELAFAEDGESEGENEGEITVEGDDAINKLLAKMVFDFATIKNYYPYDTADTAEKLAYNTGVTTFSISGSQIAALVAEVLSTVLGGDTALFSLDGLPEGTNLMDFISIPQVVISNANGEEADTLTPAEFNESTKMGITLFLDLPKAVDVLAGAYIQNLPSAATKLVSWMLPKQLYLTMLVYPFGSTEREAEISINNYDEKQQKTLATVLDALLGDQIAGMLGEDDNGEEVSSAEEEENLTQTTNKFLNVLNKKVVTVLSNVTNMVPMGFVKDGEVIALNLQHIQAILNLAGLVDNENPANSITPHMFLSALNGMANCYEVTDEYYKSNIAKNYDHIYCTRCYKNNGTLVAIENNVISQATETEKALYRCSECGESDYGYTCATLFYHDLEKNYALNEGALAESGFSLGNTAALGSITDSIDMNNLNYIDYTAYATEEEGNATMRVDLRDSTLAYLMTDLLTSGVLSTAAAEEGESSGDSGMGGLLQYLGFNRLQITKTVEKTHCDTYIYTESTSEEGGTVVKNQVSLSDVYVTGYDFAIKAEVRVADLMNSFLGNTSAAEDGEESSGGTSALLGTLLSALPQLFTLEIVLTADEVVDVDNNQKAVVFSPENRSGGLRINKFSIENTDKLLTTLKDILVKLGNGDIGEKLSTAYITDALGKVLGTVFSTFSDTLNASIRLGEGAIVLPNIYEIVSGLTYKLQKDKATSEEDIVRLSARETCEVFRSIYKSGIVTYTVTPSDTGAYVLVDNQYVLYNGENLDHVGLPRFDIVAEGGTAASVISLSDQKTMIRSDSKDGDVFLSNLSSNYYLSSTPKAKDLLGGDLTSLISTDNIIFRKSDLSTGSIVDISTYTAAELGEYSQGYYYYTAPATSFYVAKTGGEYIYEGGTYRTASASETGTHDLFRPVIYVKEYDEGISAYFFTQATEEQIELGTGLYLRRDIVDGLYRDERDIDDLQIAMSGSALASIINATGMLSSGSLAAAEEGGESSSLIKSFEIITAKLRSQDSIFYLDIELKAGLGTSSETSSAEEGEGGGLDVSKFLPDFLYITASIEIDGQVAGYEDNDGRYVVATKGEFVKVGDDYVTYDANEPTHEGLTRYDLIKRYNTTVTVNKMDATTRDNLFALIGALSGSAFDLNTICDMVTTAFGNIFGMIKEYIPLYYDYTKGVILFADLFDTINCLAFRTEKNNTIDALEESITPENQAAVEAQIALENAKKYVKDGAENIALRSDLKEFGRSPATALDAGNGQGYELDGAGDYVLIGSDYVLYDSTDPSHLTANRYRKNTTNGLDYLDNMFTPDVSSGEFIYNINKYYYINGGTSGENYITTDSLLNGTAISGSFGADNILFSGTQLYQGDTFYGIYSDTATFTKEGYAVRISDKALADLIYGFTDSDNNSANGKDHKIGLGTTGSGSVVQATIFEKDSVIYLQIVLVTYLQLDGSMASMLPDHIYVNVIVPMEKALGLATDTDPSSPTYEQKLPLTKEDVALRINALTESETDAFFTRLGNLASAFGASLGDLNSGYIKEMVANSLGDNLDAFSSLPNVTCEDGCIMLPDIFSLLIDKCDLDDLVLTASGEVVTEDVGGTLVDKTTDITPENLCARLRAFGALVGDAVTYNTDGTIASIDLDTVANLSDEDHANATIDFDSNYSYYYTKADGEQFFQDFSRNLYLNKVLTGDDIMGTGASLTVDQSSINFKDIYDYSTGTMTKVAADSLGTKYNGNYYYATTTTVFYPEKVGGGYELVMGNYEEVSAGLGHYTKYEPTLYKKVGATFVVATQEDIANSVQLYLQRNLFYGIYNDQRADSELSSTMSNTALGSISLSVVGDDGIDVSGNGNAKIAQLIISTETKGGHSYTYVTAVLVFVSDDTAAGKAVPDNLVLISRTTIQEDGEDSTTYPTTIVVNGMTRENTTQFFYNLGKIGGAGSSFDIATLESTVSNKMQEIFAGLLDNITGASYVNGGIALPSLFEYMVNSDFYQESASGTYYKSGSDYILIAQGGYDGTSPKYEKTKMLDKVYNTTTGEVVLDGGIEVTADTTPAKLRARLKEFGKVEDDTEYNSTGYTWKDYVGNHTGGASGAITSEQGDNYLDNRFEDGDADSFYQQMVDYYYLATTPDATALTGSNLFGNINKDAFIMEGAITSTLNGETVLHSFYKDNSGIYYNYGTYFDTVDNGGQKYSMYANAVVTAGSPASTGLYYYNGTREGLKLSDKSLGDMLTDMLGDSLNVKNGADTTIEVTIESVKMKGITGGFYMELTTKAKFNASYFTGVDALPEYLYITTFTEGIWNSLTTTYDCTTKLVYNSFGKTNGNSDNLIFNLSQLSSFGFDFGSWFDTSTITDNINTQVGSKLANIKTAMGTDLAFDTYNVGGTITSDGLGYIGFDNFYSLLADQLDVTDGTILQKDAIMQNMVVGLRKDSSNFLLNNSVATSITPARAYEIATTSDYITDKELGYMVKNAITFDATTPAEIKEVNVISEYEGRTQYTRIKDYFTTGAGKSYLFITVTVNTSGYHLGGSVSDILPDSLHIICMMDCEDNTVPCEISFNGMDSDTKAAILTLLDSGETNTFSGILADVEAKLNGNSTLNSYRDADSYHYLSGNDTAYDCIGYLEPHSS